jgi:pilus assembly protein Flp/PilA
MYLMRKLFTRSVKSFSRDEKGASMLEYAIVVGLVALIAIGGATVFGTNLHSIWQGQASSIGTINTTKTTN